jgi:beta-lactamase regulating signal transducer with metallopeptidase domain
MSPRARRSNRLRTLFAWATMALALAAALAPPALAGSLNNELAEKVQQQQSETPTTTTTTTTTTSSTESKTLGTKTLVLVASAAAALLAAIAFVIVRDARKVAPVTDPHLAEEATARRSAEQLRKRRARAKAARQQRKRNR